MNTIISEHDKENVRILAQIAKKVKLSCRRLICVKCSIHFTDMIEVAEHVQSAHHYTYKNPEMPGFLLSIG